MPGNIGDDQRAADLVIVPDVVGAPFLHAREIAQAAGLTLANPDPDGPPIGAIAWPKNPTVQRQSPPPGSVLYQFDSLRIWLRSDLEPDMARKLENPPPSIDWDHATPERPAQSVELSSDSPPEETSP
ncbi:PASTA domain-containing protein [Arthrobacter sp. ov407]|nr:PASTA domain-containing protein [Arthrobacter sp. ov407]